MVGIQNLKEFTGVLPPVNTRAILEIGRTLLQPAFSGGVGDRTHLSSPHIRMHHIVVGNPLFVKKIISQQGLVERNNALMV